MSAANTLLAALFHFLIRVSSAINSRFNSRSNSRFNTLSLFFLLLLCAVVWQTFSVGVSELLILDDKLNLELLANSTLSNVSSALGFIFGNVSGPGGRPISMLSFLLEAESWPTNISRLKQSNIFIHILCGVAVFFFCRKLFLSLGSAEKSSEKSSVLPSVPPLILPSVLQAELLALAVSAIWMLHPLNVSTVLYLIQRMTQLATLFALIGLICFLYGRSVILTDVRKGLRLLVLSLFPFGLLAVLSKENGALLVLAIFLMEKTLFANAATNTAYLRWFRIGIQIPLGLLLLYLALNLESVIAGYQFRNFDLVQRLLSESRILLTYLSNILMPQTGSFGLFHDDFIVSNNLFDPLSTLFSVMIICGLLASALLLRLRLPVFSFAVLWFFAWHLLESTYIPLELYFEHRNYLPMLGPIIGLSYYLMRLLENFTKENFFKPLFASLVLCVVLGITHMTHMTYRLASQWGNTAILISSWAQQHPRSNRAQSHLADILGDAGLPEKGLEVLKGLKQYYPDELTTLLQIWNYECSYDLSSSTDISEITNNSQLELQFIHVSAQMRNFTDNLLAGNCTYPEPEQVLALTERIRQLKMQRRERTLLHLIRSEILVHYGQIDKALSELDLAYENEASVNIAITQSTLAGSVGRFQQALDILQKAYDADEKRGFLLPSRVDEIEDLQISLEALLAEAS